MSKQLIFRVSDEEWDLLNDYCDDAGYKKQQVLEAILNRFLSTAPEDRQAIVEGRSGTFGDIVERLQWANHAFSVQRWSWASSEYNSLAKEAHGMDGVMRFARYRDAYCLIEESIRYRTAALSAAPLNRDGLWKQSENLCRAAIVANRRANIGAERRFGVLHPVICYNEACSWSFLGQIVVESNLKKSDKLVTLLANASGNLDSTRKVWNKIALNWQQVVLSESRQQVVRDCGTYAMQALRRMLPADQSKLDFFDTQWLGELASRHDTDLVLLASLPEVSIEFSEWVKSAKTNPESSETVRSDKLIEEYRNNLEHPELISYS